ncbi:MAG: PAS domain S-box protein [Acidobacteria bacterium]|nr:PAS domain S-box protein [Acidobacteriota bacterium]
MTHLSVKIKIIGAWVVFALVVYVAFLNLESRFHWQEISDGIVWEGSHDGVSARRVGPDGPGKTSGVGSGDILLGINGRAVHDLDDYYRWVDHVRPNSDAIYLVRKAGTGVAVSYAVPLRLKSSLTRTDVYLAVVALVYLVVGMGIFVRNWRGEFAFHFFLVCLLSFILYLFRYTGKADNFDVFVYWLSGSALLLLPPVFFHFCLNFPIRSARLPRRPLLALAYGSALALLVAHLFWFSGSFNVIGVPRSPFFRSLFDRFHIAYFTVWFCAAAGVLIHSRLHPESIEQRQQLKWIVGGTLLAIVPFAACYALPFSIGMIPNSLLEISILSLTLMPLGFGYAIIKYRLMDVDVILKRGGAYFIASSGLLAVYFVLVLLVGKLVSVYAPSAGFLLFAFAALVTAFLFHPLRNRVQTFIDRLFYKEQYGYRASFSDFSRTLSSEISLDRLSAVLLQRVQKTMNVDEVALWVLQEGDWYYMRHALNVQSEKKIFYLPERIFRDCDRELKPLYLSYRDDAPLRELRQMFHRMGLNYVQPLRAHDRAIAVLALGKRRGGEWLSTEDLDLLQDISGYAAIAIENANLYQNVESKARELEQLKVFSESIIESIQAGVLTVDPEGNITSLNAAVETLLGCARLECLGKPLSVLFPASLSDRIRTTAGDPWVITEPVNLYKVCVQTFEGQTRIVNLHIAPFVSRDDIVTGTLIVIDDVTQKTRLEDQFVQAEKLTSLGLLAAGVAHEVNTPLTGISSYAQMLLKKLPKGHPHRPILEKMENQTFRASEIVNNLLNFARLSGSEFKQVNLNHLVLETLSLLDHQLKRQNIQVSTDLDPTLPVTYGHGGKLQQVFVNLFLNAKDAMPEGGRLEVRTEQKENSVVILIKDSGRGIAKENIKKIYDPFFTTKEVGNGTGLGLSISYGIIQEHSGNIRVESEPNQGTEFTLQFPVGRIH